MPGLEDLLQIPALSPLYAVPIIAVGLLFAFFGSKIFRALIFLAGGVVLGAGLALVLRALGYDALIVVGAGALGFLVGGFIALFLLRVAIFFIGTYVGYIIGARLFPGNLIAVAVAAIVAGLVFVLLYRVVLAVFTAVLGGALVAAGLYLLRIEHFIVAIAALAVVVSGVAFQLLVFRKK